MSREVSFGEELHPAAVAPPVVPEDDGVVAPLVLRARQVGLGV